MCVGNLVGRQWGCPDAHFSHVAVEGSSAIQTLTYDDGAGLVLNHPGGHVSMLGYVARSCIEAYGVVVKVIDHYHSGEIACRKGLHGLGVSDYWLSPFGVQHRLEPIVGREFKLKRVETVAVSKECHLFIGFCWANHHIYCQVGDGESA